MTKPRAYVRPSNDGEGNVDVRLDIYLTQAQWGDFAQFCSAKGYGPPIERIRSQVLSMVQDEGTEALLNFPEDDRTFSPRYTDGFTKLAQYLVFAHLTVVATSAIIQLLIGSLSALFVVSTVAFIVSMLIALASWGGLLMKQVYSDGDRHVNIGNRDLILFFARASEKLWWVALAGLAIAVMLRAITIIVELGFPALSM